MQVAGRFDLFAQNHYIVKIDISGATHFRMHLKTANNRNREITIQNFHVTEIYIFDTSAFSIQ